MRIGLIQSGGIGDIIIALPIAKHFADRGHEVLWPIYDDCIEAFGAAAPYVRFLPLEGRRGQWMYPKPLALLKEKGCDRIIPLYSHIGGHPELLASPKLASIMKFDQYKYGVTNVPFREKWNLQIVRNKQREDELFTQVAPRGDYAICHLRGSDFVANVDVGAMAGGAPVVEITKRTDNFLDWLTVIERAFLRVTIDSCFANLIDQLQMPGKNIFLIRSNWPFTPVLLGDWAYISPATS
jgi:hypothetical protein